MAHEFTRGLANPGSDEATAIFPSTIDRSGHALTSASARAASRFKDCMTAMAPPIS